jgi:ribosomal protein S18 acetylase RimI-like enzyme
MEQMEGKREQAPAIELVRATAQDVEAYIELEKSVAGASTYSALLTPEEVSEEFSKCIVYLVKEGNQIVGSVSYEMKDPDHAYISGLVVTPARQHQGIGKAALLKVLEELKDVRTIDLVTHPDNTSSVGLYESLGFVIGERKENYFGDSEPRIMMTLEKAPQIQFPEIANEIEAMTTIDQDMRERSQAEDYWDESVDAKHTARMKEIVAQVGWPTVSKVGKDSSENAWLLVQHADRDVAFQEQCLALMKQEKPEEVNPRNIAMLEDRIRVNKNQRQIYGTQHNEVDGKYVPRPIDDEANVNERRKQMGLGTLEEGIAGMYEKYGPPKAD